MTLGVIARTDQSGLGIQSRLVVDLLQPDRVVTVDMGKHNRGAPVTIDHPNLLAASWNDPRRPNIGVEVTSFLKGCTAVYAAESFYWTALPRRLPRTRFCVAANMELWRDLGERNVCPSLPTTWLAQRHPTYPVVPHPTPVGVPAFDALAADNLARTGPARTVLHMAAPAMLDRNGSQAMLASLRFYKGPAFTLLVGGSTFAGNPQAVRRGVDSSLVWPKRVKNVRIKVLPAVEDHADLYRNVDLMVIPRRYAGQSLPSSEAAAAGVPVLMTDLSPQDEWSGVDSSIRASKGQVHVMRGGKFHVAEPDPRSIAEQVTRYTSDDGEHRHAWQQAASEWAVAGSWGNVKDRWLDWLGT